MPPKPRPSLKTGLQPPQLPKLAYAEELPGEKLLDQAQYTQLALSGGTFAEQSAQQILFEQAVFKRVNFSRTRLPRVEWRDARLEACDLSGVEWEKARLRRVELIGCRLVGAKLLDAGLEDVLIRNCVGDLALFWSAIFKVARFEHSRLREASFVKADLTGVIFRDCDLSRADLREAKLAGADFRQSVIGGMQVGLRELQGVVIDPTQTAYVAGLAGLVIRDAEDTSTESP
jgi:uncharacterized protein YjbI with pentapeptide repeats